ncbi:hypothetical protein H8F21_13685 [Pseudomonas sp. P66]|uniref:Uncharacterized protein n=1 Tax=Pseudomonas arcuscaelestis TaxID=2710591 RepID=A0ABS2C050_9PSED|nr:hypothetical protein [Pseudomonas arcuscaelestis]MBM5458616.1 hypothetical protein [Pseudomonas arcuscaelestis]
MAALHDFRFNLRKVTFQGNLVIAAAGSAAILLEECKLMSYADAQAHLTKLSSAQTVSHSAVLSLKYRHDKKPRGWNNNPRNRIDFEAPQHGA